MVKEQIISEDFDLTSSRGCQVKHCTKKRNPEMCSVYMEKGTGEIFLFTAYFCDAHLMIFSKAVVILVRYIKDGEIRGVDPRILE